MTIPKRTSTTTTLLSRVFITTLVIAVICCGKAPSTANESMSRTEAIVSQPLDYHVWRVFPEDRKGFTVVVVSVNPKHFNRDDMTSLAKELNSRFQEKSKLKVGLLDDENIARLFATGHAEYSTYETSERGRYYLDRIGCREYVEFSSEKGKPRQTVKLDCVPQRKR